MTRRSTIALLAAAAVAVAGLGGYWWMAQRRAAWRATMPPAAPPSPVGAIYPVANNLYVVPGGGGNTAVFVTTQGVVLIDPKFAGSTPALLEQVRTVTDKPVTRVINTHSHDDHSNGDSVLPATVEVIVHEVTAANLARMRQDRGQPAPARPPRTYRDRLTLFDGPDAVDLYYFGPAHTGGDTFVVFRSAGVMHAGDVFIDKTAPVINLPWGGDAVEYVETMRKSVEGINGVTRVVTGHGDVMSWADFVNYSEFMRLIVNQARTARDAGTDANQARKALVLPAKFSDYKLDRLAFTYQDIYKSLTPWWHFW